MNQGFDIGARRRISDELYFDVETIPAQQQRLLQIITEGVRSDLAAALAAVRAPSNYKDEAKIVAYVESAKAEITEDHAAKAESKLHSTGLDGAYGELYCFGFAVNDGEARIISRGTDLSADSERAIVRAWFGAVSEMIDTRMKPTLVGHNISGFDIRFIHQRAMVLGVKTPHWLQVDAKPWDETIFDTMVRWAGPRDRVSLTKLCHAFGIEDEDTITGAEVWDCIKRGEHAKVEEHCRIDIDKVRRIHRRMTFRG